jgi:copper transport protein
MKRRLVVVAVTLGVLFSVLVTPALAHALLLRSIPDANASLDRAPAQVELYFSASIDPSFSKVTVLGSTGKAVDVGDSRVDPADPTHMTVSLPSLPDGVYTVSWKALATSDGHVTTGTFPFAVGNVDAAALAAAAQASGQVKLPLGEVIARWLAYLAGAAIAGGTLFVLLIWQPAYAALEAETGPLPGRPPRWERLAVGTLVLLTCASVVSLLVEAGQVSSVEIATPWSSAVGGLLFQTRYGALWLARLALIVALAALLLRGPTTRTRWIVFGVTLLLLLVVSLGSHAADEQAPLLPTLGDWLHLSAASVWVGGLTHFTVGLWASRNQKDATGRPLASRLAARLLPRFSLLALVSVDVIVLTGLYDATLRLGSWDLLFNTLYGKTLIVKILLAMPMVGMGAVNLLWTTPRMKRAALAAADAPVVPFFRRFVTSEVALGAAVLLTVGVLTNLPPAINTAQATNVNASATVNDLKLVVTIEPGKVGLNTFTLQVTSNGQPVIGAKEVALRFTPTIASLAPSQAELTDMGNGKYSIRGAYFSLPDTWQVQAVVRRDGQFDAFANFNFPLGATTSAYVFPWNRVTGGLLLLAAVLLFFVLQHTSPRSRPLRLAGQWVPVVALCLVGGGGVLSDRHQQPGLWTNEPDCAKHRLGGRRAHAVRGQLRAVPRGDRQGRWAGGADPEPAPGRPDPARGAGRAYRWHAVELDH